MQYSSGALSEKDNSHIIKIAEYTVKYEKFTNYRSSIVFILFCASPYIQAHVLDATRKNFFPGTVIVVEPHEIFEKLMDKYNETEFYTKLIGSLSEKEKLNCEYSIPLLFTDFAHSTNIPKTSLLKAIIFEPQSWFAKLSANLGKIWKLRPYSDKNYQILKICDLENNSQQFCQILSDVLGQRGISIISEKMLRIRGRQIYLLSSQCPEISTQKAVFHPRGWKAMEIVLPFAWNEKRYGKNWFAQLHMWRLLDDYILRYEQSRDPVWLELPISIIEDWHQFFQNNAPVKGVWETMNAGLRAMKLAWFMGLHKSGEFLFPAAFITICEELARQHADFILKTHPKQLYNHTVMDIHGAMALAWMLNPVEAQKVFNHVDNLMEELLISQFDESGIHREHSPYYHIFGIECLKRLHNSGWFSRFELNKIIKNAENNSPWFYLPDGRLAPIGDTPPEKNYHDRNIFNKKETLLASSGYVIIREGLAADASYLLFMGAKNSCVHKHEDDMSIIWYEGEDILCDCGKFAYGNTKERAYSISARAHNTMEIVHNNATGLPNFEGKTNLLINSGRYKNLYYICGQKSLKGECLVHYRNILYMPGNFLFVFDKVESDAPNDFKFFWHFPVGAKVMKSNKYAYFLRLKSNKKINMDFYCRPISKFEIITGKKNREMQGFISDGNSLLQPAPCLEILFNTTSDIRFISKFSMNDNFDLHEIAQNIFNVKNADCDITFSIKNNNFLFN